MYRNNGTSLIHVLPDTQILPGQVAELSKAQLEKRDVQRLIARGVLTNVNAHMSLADAKTVKEVVMLAEANKHDREFVARAFEYAQTLQKKNES